MSKRNRTEEKRWFRPWFRQLKTGVKGEKMAIPYWLECQRVLISREGGHCLATRGVTFVSDWARSSGTLYDRAGTSRVRPVKGEWWQRWDWVLYLQQVFLWAHRRALRRHMVMRRKKARQSYIGWYRKMHHWPETAQRRDRSRNFGWGWLALAWSSFKSLSQRDHLIKLCNAKMLMQTL